MLLKLGDSGNAVKVLQADLNKLGSILLVDGDFGPLTGDAVTGARIVLDRPGPGEADDELQNMLAVQPDPFPLLTAAGVTFIARAEVSGPREYRRKYRHPVWPSVDSGITIGIGYDLQFVTRLQLFAEWGERLSPDALSLLAGVLGEPGSPDQLARVRDVDIPLLDAMSVFLQRTLPRHLARTRSIYPQIDDLPPPRRTALVSLVYNRGKRLKDTDPTRQDRREMREIRRLLRVKRFDEVAEQLDSMARLWDRETLPGLVQRRHNEAKLWRSGFAVLQLA